MTTPNQEEIARLRACLEKANNQAEHFEREWYLRGDELARLREQEPVAWYDDDMDCAYTASELDGGTADGLAPLYRAAPPAQPAEPDMRHPKIQSLIGSMARCQIELQLVEQLLEDPNFEATSMDMEHWGPMHDKLKAILVAAAQPAPAQPSEPAQRLSDDDIDRTLATTLDALAKLYGIDHAMHVRTDIAEHHTLRRAFARAIEAAIVPPGYVVLEAESVREIIADVEQHIGQGKDSEQRLAADNPGYGTGTYTHLWRKMQKLRAMIAAAPKASHDPR